MASYSPTCTILRHLHNDVVSLLYFFCVQAGNKVFLLVCTLTGQAYKHASIHEEDFIHQMQHRHHMHTKSNHRQMQFCSPLPLSFVDTVPVIGFSPTYRTRLESVYTYPLTADGVYSSRDRCHTVRMSRKHSTDSTDTQQLLLIS